AAGWGSSHGTRCARLAQGIERILITPRGAAVATHVVGDRSACAGALWEWGRERTRPRRHIMRSRLLIALGVLAATVITVGGCYLNDSRDRGTDRLSLRNPMAPLEATAAPPDSHPTPGPPPKPTPDP